jgi:predicted ferric reductase
MFMTAANERLAVTGFRPAAVPPALAGRLVFALVLALNLAVVEVMFATAAPARSAVLGLGRWLGLHLAFIMILQLVLIARLPFLDRRIGMDRLTSWHRWTGFTLFWLVLLHPFTVVLGYATAYGGSMLSHFRTLLGFGAILAGLAAATIILFAAGLSVRYVRRRLQYETWHAIHLCLYVAVVLGLIHQLFEASTFTSSPLAEAYWWSLWAFALISLLAGRVVLPLWRNARHQFRVAAVVPEADNVVSVYVTGKHLEKLPARAGQFFIWRFLGHGRWWEANPFSMSAAPNGRSLRLTAKAVGTASARLRSVPIGTRVFAEGPYGAFTTLSRTKPGILLIAGGVGITPIRALLEELTEPAVVLYRAHAMRDAVLLAELQALANAHGSQVHVLTGRTGAGNPPNTPFAPENLAALVPDIRDRDIYVCGPNPMTTAVIRSLRALKIPSAQIHSERFSLAG